MKKLFLILSIGGAVALTVYGQGRVNFASPGFDPSNAITIAANNQGTSGGLTGQGIGGDKYAVQLVWVLGSGLTQAQFDAGVQHSSPACTGIGTGSASASFFANTGPVASGGGFFDAGTIPNPVGNTMPGGWYTAQVWAWYNVGLSTYAAAEAANKNVGKSILFNMNSQMAPGPPTTTGFPGFLVGWVPEPSTFSLAAVTAAGMLLFRRKK